VPTGCLVACSRPKNSSLHFNGYALDAGDSEISFTDNEADEFVIRSDCEEKVKYIIRAQRPVIYNHFEQHSNDFSPGGINFEEASYTSAMKTYCMSMIDLVKYNNSQSVFHQGDEERIAYYSETHSRREPIRFLSATDIEIGGHEKGTGSHWTRIPLSSLQDRIHANDSEMDFIISKLGLADAMQKSKALVHCKTLTNTTLCDTDEFKPETAKQQLNPDLTFVVPHDISH